MICGFLNAEINLLQLSGEHELVWFMLLPPSTVWLIWQQTENGVPFVFWTCYHSNVIVFGLSPYYAMLFGTCYSLKFHVNNYSIQKPGIPWYLCSMLRTVPTQYFLQGRVVFMTVAMTSLRLQEGNNISLSQFRFRCIDTLYLTLNIFVLCISLSFLLSVCNILCLAC